MTLPYLVTIARENTVCKSIHVYGYCILGVCVNLLIDKKGRRGWEVEGGRVEEGHLQKYFKSNILRIKLSKINVIEFKRNIKSQLIFTVF